ncbi:hypothetical protein FLK61_23900 [Paenalkalicoccus suaedae]|uniref:Uncharacterized protein n=1 Tax=Paenalkalicoccus suaedae TaxID=2592382 RepID=A0A859F9J9_9BACI|nr:hypothetical protein [Paenalkalicoccus suaedae]QKS69833.1 hypothetical protein FLK61_23900 [Paenalkalicoccus suaedae]
MNIYQSILRVQLNEVGKSLRIFWSIWLLILIISYIVATLGAIEEFFFVSFVPAIVWIAIYSFKAVSSDLPYVLKLGASRQQLIVAAAILVAGLSILMTGLHFIFTELFSFLATNIEAIQPIILINWATGDSLTIFHSLLLDLIVSMVIGSIMVLFAVLYVRFGKLPMYLAGAIVVVSMPIPAVHERVFQWLTTIQSGEILVSLLVFIITAISCIIISKQMILKASLR